MPVSILLVDDDPVFLDLTREYLESADYLVYTASDATEARQIVATTHLHLAILDMRLTDPSDEKDKGGLLLAKQLPYTLPKLIATKFPAHRDVVEALRPTMHPLPPAVDFVDKRDGFPALLVSIQQALEQHVKINWDLHIHWQTYLSFSQLAQLIDATLEADLLVSRAVELEDLFRRLFFECTQITVDEILIDALEHVLLKVYGYNGDGAASQHVVSCGQRHRIQDKMARYQTAVWQRPMHLDQPKLVETTHFAAIAYRFSGGDLESAQSLAQFYGTHPLEEVQTAVSHLYHHTWYQNGRRAYPRQHLYNFYMTWLQRDNRLTSVDAAYSQLQALSENLLTNNLGQFEVMPHTLSLRIDKGSVKLCPNPVLYLAGDRLSIPSRVLWGTTHGQVNGQTVLVGLEKQTWLIDFSQTGEAPLLHDFVSLETAVTLHLLTNPSLAHYYQFVQHLFSRVDLTQQPEGLDLPADMVGALHLIGHIRQLAAELAHCDWPTYQIGLFFMAFDQLLKYQSDVYPTRRTLIPFARALITTALLCQKWQGALVETADVPTQAADTLWIDQTNKTVWVEGQQIELTVQDFQILNYLYQHAGQLCERQDIIEEGLGEIYDPYDAEQSRLNSAISRLRRKIEPDPDQAQYLITVRKRGYRLEV